MNLSLILPTVNRGALLKSPLESIIPQLKKGDQLVISINSENTGETLKVISEYESVLRAINLSIFTTETKLNIYEHWDFAISKAVYEECVFIHDDEIYHSQLLEIAREEFTRDPEVCLVTGGHIRVIAPSMNCYDTISFPRRSVFNQGCWIESQKQPTFPRYGCTSYIFRKEKKGYPFFKKNSRVSDALLMYHQSFIGKVVERPEFFGTRLLHSENTSHTDYLELNHVPYWMAMKELGEDLNVSQLEEIGEELRIKAPYLYRKNAYQSALPRNNREGFAECLRQCKLAGSGERFVRFMKLIYEVRPLWFIFSKILKLAKKVFGKKYNETSGLLLNRNQFCSNLKITSKQWDLFCERVNIVSK